jgi:hypothetical protein
VFSLVFPCYPRSLDGPGEIRGHQGFVGAVGPGEIGGTLCSVGNLSGSYDSGAVHYALEGVTGHQAGSSLTASTAKTLSFVAEGCGYIHENVEYRSKVLVWSLVWPERAGL